MSRVHGRVRLVADLSLVGEAEIVFVAGSVIGFSAFLLLRVVWL